MSARRSLASAAVAVFCTMIFSPLYCTQMRRLRLEPSLLRWEGMEA